MDFIVKVWSGIQRKLCSGRIVQSSKEISGQEFKEEI